MQAWSDFELKLLTNEKNHNKEPYIFYKMRYDNGEKWEYEIGNLYNWRIDGGIEEIDGGIE